MSNEINRDSALQQSCMTSRRKEIVVGSVAMVVAVALFILAFMAAAGGLNIIGWGSRTHILETGLTIGGLGLASAGAFTLGFFALVSRRHDPSDLFYAK